MGVEEKITDAVSASDNTDDKAPGLEERFEALEDILEKLECADVTLDQSFELYRNGIEELKAANAMLDEIEKAMLVMAEDGTLEEFDGCDQ